MTIKVDRDAMRERVATLRNLRGWSQKDLATMAGISQATISQIESGARQLNDLGTALRLAHAFELSMDQFLDEDYVRTLRDRRLSMAEKQRFADTMIERGTVAECPICNRNDWGAIEAFVLAIAGSDNRAQVAVSAICGHCGFIRLHNLHAIDLGSIAERFAGAPPTEGVVA
jgi:transcriptional regulator with XRE-family HTH domain